MSLLVFWIGAGGGGPSPVGAYASFWHYISSLSYTGTVNDKLRAHLTAQGYSGYTVNDDMNRWFASLGYTTGTLQDKLKDWEEDYLV